MDSNASNSKVERNSNNVRRRRKALLQVKADRSISNDETKFVSKDETKFVLGEMALKCGSVSLMGRRKNMEDTFIVRPEIVAEKFAFFGVYDGHGGDSVANACRDRMHKLVEGELLAMIYNEGFDWTNIMKKCFSKMDDEVLKDKNGMIIPMEKVASAVGSTATVVIVGTEETVVANCGDSRAILYRDGVVVPLTTDHTPNIPDEVERVEAAGGQILYWNGSRVQGVLAVSRSIGDHSLKPYVISEPAVTIIKRNKSDEFIIIATDGLWDVFPNEVACEFVRKHFKNRKKTRSAKDVANFLANEAIAKGSQDNISVIVVKLETES